MMFNSRWIAIEGPDGCGKTTQAKLLADALGFTHVREPGSTPLGETLRELLLHGDDLTTRTELLLMMAGRSHLYDERIRGVLEGGGGVVSDRSYLSSMVYQEWIRPLITGRVDPHDSDAVLETHLRLFPELPTTIVLLVSPKTCMERRGGGGDRIETHAMKDPYNLVSAYHACACQVEKVSPRAITSVRGEGAVNEVHQRLLTAVKMLSPPK